MGSTSKNSFFKTLSTMPEKEHSRKFISFSKTFFSEMDEDEKYKEDQFILPKKRYILSIFHKSAFCIQTMKNQLYMK